MIDVLLIFLIGLTAGFIGAFATGAGLISIPLFIVIGIPSYIALATHKIGMLGQCVGSFSRYVKTDYIKRELVLPLTALGILGAYVGSSLVIQISNELLLQRFIAIVIICMIPFYFFKKNLGILKKKVSSASYFLGFVFFAFISVWSGFLGT